jgi:hypothetical protein
VALQLRHRSDERRGRQAEAFASPSWRKSSTSCPPQRRVLRSWNGCDRGRRTLVRVAVAFVGQQIDRAWRTCAGSFRTPASRAPRR